MGRGIQLACEQCSFSEMLLERVPFALDSAGQPVAVEPGSAAQPAGYWSDSLCPECRLPVRTTEWTPGQAAAVSVKLESATCPRCSSAVLSFEDALRELAEACHSRAWVDLAAESEARRRVEAAITAAEHLRDAIDQGDCTTLEALDDLARQVTLDPGTSAGTASASMPLDQSATLDNLGPLIENALDVESAAQALQERLRRTQVYIAGLQSCVEDETYLPGVPCPQCGTGHLVHWPVWA